MTAHLHPAPGGVGAVVASRRPALKVADVFRRHGEAYAAAHVLTPAQGRVLGALRACRTAVLGGHLEVCDTCGFERPAYNSCRNRHCPGCQALAQREWLEKRLERVLPTHHFHVVFTLPAELRPVALRNGKVVYGLIMRAAHEVLSTLGRQRLGATLGVTEVLQHLTREIPPPRPPRVVTGGGLAMDGSRWSPSPRRLSRRRHAQSFAASSVADCSAPMSAGSSTSAEPAPRSPTRGPSSECSDSCFALSSKALG